MLKAKARLDRAAGLARATRGFRCPAGVGAVSCSAALLLVACGGSKKDAASADETNGPATPGQQCLNDADAAYEPRADAPNRIDLEHIVVRHAGSKGAKGVTRSAEEACLRALEAWKKLQGGADWDAIVEEYNDAKGAAGGKLSRVSMDELDADFAAVAFSLDESELSYVAKTERGFHLIMRK